MQVPGVLLVIILLGTSAYGQSDTLYRQLSETIRDRKGYENLRRDRIQTYNDNLSTLKGPPSEAQFKLLSRLCEEYKTFQYDSAFNVTRKLQLLAYALKDPVKTAYATNQLGFVMLSSGLFKETLDSLQHLSIKNVPDSVKLDYYQIMVRVHYDLIDYDRDSYFAPRYLKLGNIYTDSVLMLTTPNSYTDVYYRSQRNIKNGNSPSAVAELRELLARPLLTQHQVAIIASTLSHCYVLQGDLESAIPLSMRAAIADIRTATKETTAISNLAEMLYKKGDVVHAYDCIQQAMEDAIYYGARQRKVQVSSILPVIASSRLNNVEGQRRLWLIYSSVITVLSLLVLIFAAITFLQLKKRKAAEKALQESNRIKEEYIGYYLNLNSDYVNKIDAFKKSIEMKLMTRKVDDIRTTLDNLNMKKEREELYTSFDKIFLKLFPDFVTVFNSYFVEQNRIELKEGQLMNTELRIFALIRMGIHDTEKIARILDYSINTIYNYKARVKGKSMIPNEEFEKKIMEIHA
jgi:tetratricopeptide (TPR) repeat protein